jgi:branched-subunit amino acid transport protein
MNQVLLVLAAAAVTFASRVTFLVVERKPPGGFVARFLALFPLTLFVALATAGLAAPDGEVAATPALAAAGGAIVGALVTRRSLLGVLAFGVAAYAAARALA